MKKVVSVLLICFLLCSVLPVYASNAESISISYTLNGESITRLMPGSIDILMTGQQAEKHKMIAALLKKDESRLLKVRVDENKIEDFEITYEESLTAVLKIFVYYDEGSFYCVDILSDNGGSELDGSKVINDLLLYSGKNTHPRIMMTESDFQNIRSSTDALYVSGISNVTASADLIIGMSPLEYSKPDGIRLLGVSRSVLARVRTLSMAYRLTEQSKYAQRAWQELQSAASFPDWNPYHFLDVGEMCEAFAVGYDWLYDWLSAAQKKTIRDAIVEKGLNPAMDDYLDRQRTRTYNWYQDTPGDNWKCVCNGGIASAVLAICDEDDVDKSLCGDILHYAFKSIYEFVRSAYNTDGSYEEGMTYWAYASDYLAYFDSALKSAVGKDYGLTDYKPIKKSANYVRSMCSNTKLSFNYGDAEETYIHESVFLWFAKNFKTYDVADIRAGYLRNNLSQVSDRDLMWYVPGCVTEAPRELLESGEVGASNASFRSSWDANGLYAAIHFGKNNAYHGQADTGSFVLDYHGKRFFSDLGQDNYNVPQYEYSYRYRAEGHNTLVFEPNMITLPSGSSRYNTWVVDSYRDQKKDSNCTIKRFKSGNGSFAIADMNDAYFGRTVERGMKMLPKRNGVILRDWVVMDSSETGYWFAHTKANITLSDDSRSAVLDIGGDKIWVGILTGGLTFDIMDAVQLNSSLIPVDNEHTENDGAYTGQRNNSAYKKLAIRLSGSTDITVAFVPLANLIPTDENTTAESGIEELMRELVKAATTPLNEWQ